MRFIRRKEVQALTGLPTSTLYALMSAGRFPKPIRLSYKAAAWIDEDVERWMNERVAESRGEAA